MDSFSINSIISDSLRINYKFTRNSGKGALWYPSCGNDARIIHHPIFNSIYIRPSLYILNDIEDISCLYDAKIEHEILAEYKKGQIKGIDASLKLIEFTFKHSKYIKRRNVIFINSDNETVAEWLINEKIDISYMHNYHMGILGQFSYTETAKSFNSIVKKLNIQYLSVDVHWQCFSKEVIKEINRYRLLGVYSYENISNYKNFKLNEGFFQLYDLSKPM